MELGARARSLFFFIAHRDFVGSMFVPAATTPLGFSNPDRPCSKGYVWQPPPSL
jgi:hypothetical protein